MKKQIVLLLVFTNILFSQNNYSIKYSGYVISKNGVLSEEYLSDVVMTFNYKNEGDIKMVYDGDEEEFDLFSKYGKEETDVADTGQEYTYCKYFSDRVEKIFTIQIFKGGRNIRIVDGDDYLEYFE